MINKIKFYAGWLMFWLPPAIIFFSTKPFIYIHDKSAELCNHVDNKLIAIYTKKGGAKQIKQLQNERNY